MMINIKTMVLAAFLFLACCECSYVRESDKIVHLPDAPSTVPSMYSGYLDLDNGKHYFYWLVEAETDPDNAPLVLWLNGGPGCSSLTGLFTENGPFFPNGEGFLSFNPYSWNRLANMLYLESPAGVGFSYCDGGCSTTNDNTTADDNYAALQKFYEAFEKYSNNDFYIFGESYAGHYIPTLVYRIYVNSVKNPDKLPQKNFKGFGAGNPLTDEKFDFGPGLDLYYQTHGLLPLGAKGQPSGKFNPYDILVDVCDAHRVSQHVRFPHPYLDTKPDKDDRKRFVPNPDPCVDAYLTNYLNRADVKKAIHAQGSIKWEECGGPNYQFGHESMIPYYNEFMKHTNYKILVYSGDADTVLNFISTEQWIDSLNMNVKSKWDAWTYNRLGHGLQTGGWKVEYDRMTFQTIKGAGHMVPWFQPAPAFELFSSFIEK